VNWIDPDGLVKFTTGIPQSAFKARTTAGTTYDGTTSRELFDAINDIQKNNEVLDELTIKSHGNDEGMWDDNGEAFPSADEDRGKVWLTNDKGQMRDVLSTLQNITDTDSIIRLRGCNSLCQAENLYDLLGNGTDVVGNVTQSSGIPWTTSDISWGGRWIFHDGRVRRRGPILPLGPMGRF
jgi:hypothetical protein